MANRYQEVEDKLKMLIYGMPGAGKTWVASTAAADERLQNVLMLEAFGNPISLRKMEVRPDIISISEMADFNDVYDWIVRGQDPNDDYVKTFDLHPPYKTLIVDGLTEIQRFVVRKISGVDYSPPGNLTPPLPRQGFGQLLGTMLNWATHFFALDLNIVMTCLEAMQTDQVTGMLHRHPLLWGQSGGELAGYAYTVMRLTNTLVAERLLLNENPMPNLDNIHEVGFFIEQPQYYAKDQAGIGVSYLLEPTMGKILDLIDQGKNTPVK